MSRPSNIDICNIALNHVGHSEIRDYTETNGPQCKAFYDFDRRWLLNRYDWSFARRRKLLQSLVTPNNDTVYTFGYQIPSDCLAPRFLEPGGNKVTWEVYSDEIHTDLDCAYLVYTEDLTNTEKFSPLFVDLLALKIASKLAQSLGSDKQMRNVLVTEFNVAYDLYVAEDAEIGNVYKRDELNPDNDSWVTI